MKADVIIFSGQSNMQGQTEGCPSPNLPVENAFEYRWGYGDVDCLQPLQHPVGELIDHVNMYTKPAHLEGGSLTPDFCRVYTAQTGKPVVAIHVAKGATTIAEWQHGTQRYHFVAKKISAGLKKAAETYEIEKVYFVWLQGESDAIIKTEEADYFQRLTALKNQLKKDFSIDKFGIIKVGYFTDNAADDEKIMAAQERAAKQDDDFVMLTRICTKLSLDSAYINPQAHGHYNNRAMTIIAEEAATALAKL